MASFLGVDPGKQGGLALIGEDRAVLGVAKMPETDRDLLDLLHNWTSGPLGHGSIQAVIERVHSSPQMGVTSAFTFGRGYGALRMALTACEIPFDDVTPQRWQKALGCLTGGDKNRSKSRAQSLFPAVKVTHALADALLIAEYLRRSHLIVQIGNSGVPNVQEEAREENPIRQEETAVQEGRRKAAPQRPSPQAR